MRNHKAAHARAKERYKTDPDYRARRCAYSRSYYASTNGFHRKEAHLKKKFGITAAERDAMVVAQGGCAICRQLEPTTKHTWHVDHCHETKRVRGILCHGCNTALGLMQDNPEIMRAAASYVEVHRA